MKNLKMLILFLTFVFVLAGCVPSEYTEGVKIPRDYPDRDLEIYDGAVVFKAEDDRDSISIKCGSEDDLDDIIEFYQDVFEDNDMEILLEDEGRDDYYAEGISEDNEFTFELEVYEPTKEVEQKLYKYIIEIEVDFDVEVEIKEPKEEQPQQDATPEPTAQVTAEPTMQATAVPLTTDDLAAGLDRNVEYTLSQYLWEVNGFTVDAASGNQLPEGYPKVFDPDSGVVRCEFNPETQVITYYWIVGDAIDTIATRTYWVDASNTYVYAFERDENIDGAVYYVRSVFFVSNGVMYECEQIDGIDSTNYVAYDAIAMSSGGMPLTTDSLAAGLDRNVEQTLSSYDWIVNGRTVDANPNPDLPQGYPRVFTPTAGETMYRFDASTKMLTLYEMNSDGVVSETSQSYTVDPSNTYVTSFVRVQTIDGENHEMRSVYFVSDGIMYECEQMDGLDSSNYLAYFAYEQE